MTAAQGIVTPGTPEAIARRAAALRKAFDAGQPTLASLLEVFAAWADGLDSPACRGIPGMPFLRMWLRRNTLEPLLRREFGDAAALERWTEIGGAEIRAFPLGVVGHWPAGNIEIQPFLSVICALLGGNTCLARVPSGILAETNAIAEALGRADPAGTVAARLSLVAFDSDRRDCHEAMAKAVDGAMIWGGEEAVLSVRSLPFPHWARFAIFGPRISVAVMGEQAWKRAESRPAWCRRLARDVWQFEQQACSSPQILFVESRDGAPVEPLLQDLVKAFREENRLHPLAAGDPSLAAAVANARAAWTMERSARSAFYDLGPGWTLLAGEFDGKLPDPVQSRTLYVLQTRDLEQAIAALDGNVQTLGTALAEPAREADLAALAGRRGIDRVVRIGHMHVFDSPWDGQDLVRPMVRIVKHLRGSD
jgi:hypothetical protein